MKWGMSSDKEMAIIILGKKEHDAWSVACQDSYAVKRSVAERVDDLLSRGAKSVHLYAPACVGGYHMGVWHNG